MLSTKVKILPTPTFRKGGSVSLKRESPLFKKRGIIFTGTFGANDKKVTI
jgi:hypothetical protein